MGQLNHRRWHTLTPKINGQLHLNSGTVARIGSLDRGDPNVLLQQCGPTPSGDAANLVLACIYWNRLSAGKLWKIRHEIVTSVDLVEWLPVYADTENTTEATALALSQESVAANKITGVRAAMCHDTYSARQGVEHDDMNVLCLGARIVGIELARELIAAFLGARFSAEERHMRRLEKIKAMEAS